MAETTKLKVAILWHMHQPYYFNPQSDRFEMPWVRFHGLKDYLDMPLLAAENDKIKVTFNLVPSLLDQIDLYGEGKSDRHLELSRIPALNLSFEQKREILATFFSAHYQNMIDPYIRYRQLFRKKDSCGSDLDLAVEIFSSSEFRDLQVWSNLVWIDPIFRIEQPVRALFEKGRDFTEDDKVALLRFQVSHLKRIIPTYQRLYKEKRIDVSFTPYYHPILPLLVDTDSAREAIPEITLPANRFSFPEDARWHIKSSIAKFKDLFGEPLRGMWPSEGSISEEVLGLMAEEGIAWTASDQEVLHHSAIKSGRDPHDLIPHSIYHFEKYPQLNLFFRDRGLSDRIGFVYSNWDPLKAATDFVENIKNLKSVIKDNIDDAVIPVILDGENAWEYFPKDGLDFLRNLYNLLADDHEIETVFFRDAAREIKSKGIPRIFAGSWISHNFKIWIGHPEDNLAWDLLYSTRKYLSDYVGKNPNTDAGIIEKAWRQVHFTEGSDWCWWYGDDHKSDYNAQFDELYRTHLKTVYTILDQDPPPQLSRPIHQSGMESFISKPESLITPELDGRLTHYYEWSGAGVYDCRKAGQAMHRSDRAIGSIHFAFDYDNIYIRLDFEELFDLNSQSDALIVLDFKNNNSLEIPLGKNRQNVMGQYEYIYKQLLEIRISRKLLMDYGAGRLELFVSLYAGSKLLEKWPPDDPIVIDIPEQEKEIFWQV